MYPRIRKRIYCNVPVFRGGITGIVEFSAIEFRSIIQPAETGTSGIERLLGKHKRVKSSTIPETVVTVLKCNAGRSIIMVFWEKFNCCSQ